MTQGFDEYWDKENVRFDDSYHKHKETYDLGAASRQAEIDKIKSDNQLFESQIGQVCVKWKEVAEKRQAEIDELQKRLAMYEREGYKLVPVDELLRKVQNIRALNTGEYASDEIEENVCEIESMIGACDD